MLDGLGSIYAIDVSSAKKVEIKWKAAPGSAMSRAAA
jgi:hypothetical protein